MKSQPNRIKFSMQKSHNGNYKVDQCFRNNNVASWTKK